MKHLERVFVFGLIIVATVMFGVSASSKSIGVPVMDTQAAMPLKYTVQFKQKIRRSGPCIQGDTYDRKQRSCKGADSAAYARGDRAAGRCKASDRYNARKKTCRMKDKKTYPASMKLAASLADSQKSIKERRMKRRSAMASKHGSNPGDGWNRSRKMCVHYYKGKK